MKNILTSLSFLLGLTVVDVGISLLLACTPQERQDYQSCLSDCVSAGPGTAGCTAGCFLGGLFTGCVFGSEEEKNDFKEYLKTKSITFQERAHYTQEEAQQLFEEYQKFKQLHK